MFHHRRRKSHNPTLESLEPRRLFHGTVVPGAELPVLTISAQPRNASESGIIRSFTLTRTGPTTDHLHAHLLVGGKAKNGIDYGRIGSAITIPEGQSSIRIKVRPVDDKLIEKTEALTLTLVTDEAYALDATHAATIRITDNDGVAAAPKPIITITAPDADASESGTVRSFTLARTGAITKALAVNLLVGGAATNGVDYNVIAASAVIPAGAASIEISVQPIDDSADEPTEAVTITLQPGSDYTLSTGASATIRISDDDLPPLPVISFAQSTLSASEGGPAKTITLQRSGPIDDAVTVNLQTSGSAANGVDYGTIGAALTIPAGAATASFSFTPIDDSSVESTETAIITLAPGSTYQLASPTSLTITLSDNDTAPVSNNISWSTKAANPIIRAEALKAVVDGKLYVFGGFMGDDGPVVRSDVYDPANNTWTQLPDLPKRLTHSGVASLGHDIYIGGGYVGIGAIGYNQQFGTREVWKYNIDSKSWTSMPLMPKALAGGGCAIIGNILHYVGGNDSNRADAGDHYALDLNNIAAGWTALASLPDPRSHFGTAVFNGKIYALGGQHGNDAALTTVKSAHAYDPSTNTWTKLADLPVAVSHIASATTIWGNRIIIAGGETAHEQATNRVTAYDPATNTWASMTNLPATRFSGVAAVIDNALYFTTGSSQTTTWKGVLI